MMFAKLAQIDLQNLRAAGYQPTDEDVVKLNDIAVKIETSKEPTVVNAPRAATAGSVTLYEPTVGALIWWNEIGKDSFSSDKIRLYGYFFMLANSRNVSYLQTLDNQKKTVAEVKKWVSGIDATDAELWRALLYVKRAYDFIDDDAVKNATEDEDFINSLWYQIIACAGASGIKPEDLMTQTQSNLVSLLVQANLHAKIPMKQSVAKEYIKYRQLIKEIEERGKTNG